MTGIDEGKAFNVDALSHEKFEDVFYDPMACRPFYYNTREPIWFGRLDNVQTYN